MIIYHIRHFVKELQKDHRINAVILFLLGRLYRTLV